LQLTIQNLNIIMTWKNETTISKIGRTLRSKYMNGNSLKARWLTFAMSAYRKNRSGSFLMPIVRGFAEVACYTSMFAQLVKNEKSR